MKCLVCEKELKSVKEVWIKDSDIHPQDELQPDEGGKIRVSFNFGSHFDVICVRDPDGSGSKPNQNALKHKNRSVNLAACSHIYAVICDDCFDKKANLFKGFEKTDNELELVVK